MSRDSEMAKYYYQQMKVKLWNGRRKEPKISAKEEEEKQQE